MTTATMGVSRARYEITGYFRSWDQVFFTFLFPVVMFGIFAAVFGGIDIPLEDGSSMSMAAYYLPAMLAAGVLLLGVQNLAIDIAGEKTDGTLKRLGGTPLAPIAYFAGKFGQVALTGVLQAALLLTVAHFAFGVDLPGDAAHWLTFAWVFAGGLVTCALLGIALSALPRTGRSASAVVAPIVLVLQFISGVYLQFSLLPEWMQQLASLFPLKWIAQGMRAAFLPDEFAGAEVGGAWNLGLVALAIGIWFVVGVVVSRLTFRWIRRDA